MNKDFFTKKLEDADIDIYNAIKQEEHRQQNNIELIASENIVSKAVLDAQGSILTNKYAEGYPNRRYYGGCEFVDIIEQLAIDRAKELFNCEYANVQAHSGSQANTAVFLALLNPQDTIMGMELSSGGHLTHGSAVSLSGKVYKSCGYKVDKATHLINYDELEEIAIANKPNLIIAGASAYSREIDFAKFRAIADKVGAYLMVDMAHIAGLVATGLHMSPVPYADVITSTTHKTLRGARGGLILSNNKEIMKKINSAVFPGIQGGPLMQVIAGKAVAFKEALSTEYKAYMQQVVLNAKVMAQTFMDSGYSVVTGGTDTHLFLVNVFDKGLTGQVVEKCLDEVNITLNKNSIPYDSLPYKDTSGIRIGTPVITTRGFKEKESKEISKLIIKVLQSIDVKNATIDDEVKNYIKTQVLELCKNHPIN